VSALALVIRAEHRLRTADRAGGVPGVVGRPTALHATYYDQRCEPGPEFEADIAPGIAAFVGRSDPATDGCWTVVDRTAIVRGGIVVDGRAAGDRGAQFRYFLVDPALHGEGLGLEDRRPVPTLRATAVGPGSGRVVTAGAARRAGTTIARRRRVLKLQ